MESTRSSFDLSTLPAVLAEFHRDGVAVVGGALSSDEVQRLREVTDELIDQPAPNATRWVENVYGTSVLRYTQSLHRVFCDMLVHPVLLPLAEAVLGPGCTFCGQNVIRSGKGNAISLWHVDDTLEFPLPDDVPRFDARLTMPVNWMSLQIALSDIDSPEHGPTEMVRGSHYSGRNVPRETDVPMFEGNRPEPILCKAGDVYLFNHQVWHRGSPNTSGRMRYLMQNQYAKRWTTQRFANPNDQCRLSEEQLDGLPKRFRELWDIGIPKKY